MVMADLFKRSGASIGFAHCNFQLRGDDADRDEAFVKSVAASYGVPFYSRRFDTNAYAINKNISVQMAAREQRYAFFEEIALNNNYQLIATAHHLDDQTETFFINLLRGCGIAGLHGIRLRKGNIVRPMMFATRSEIEAYVHENSIAFRTDHTNAETKYMRNSIRHNVIPALLDLNPDFQREMARNIGRLAEVEHIYRREIDRHRSSILQKRDDVYYLDINTLKELEPLHTILYEMISEFGFRESDAVSIAAALDTFPGKTFYSASHRLLIDREEIIIETMKEKIKAEHEYYLSDTDRSISAPLFIDIQVLNAQDYAILSEKNTASLDYDRLIFPLQLRKWRPGDHFIPLGMQNRKKLSDFLIDEKIPRFDKENIWVLCSDTDIVWVVGERIDDRYKISAETRKVYLLTLRPYPLIH